MKKRDPGEEHSSPREHRVQSPPEAGRGLVSVRKGKNGWWEFSEGETEDGRDLDLQRGDQTMQGLVGQAEYLGLHPNRNGWFLKECNWRSDNWFMLWNNHCILWQGNL